MGNKVNVMITRAAIRILMLSPFYFRLDLLARRILITEFCRGFQVNRTATPNPT